MTNPNAFAAALSAAVTIGTQWLVQRYAHVALSDYWKTAVTSGVTVVVLYIGSHGVKAAAGRILNGPKTMWTGASPPATPAKGSSS